MFFEGCIVILLGESQADHQEAGQNQTTKKQLLQYLDIAGVVLCIVSVT